MLSLKTKQKRAKWITPNINGTIIITLTQDYELASSGGPRNIPIINGISIPSINPIYAIAIPLPHNYVGDISLL